MEHLALMEKCVGRFPSAMLAKAPRTRDFFDERSGESRGPVECDAENRRHIRRMKRLEVGGDTQLCRETSGMRACFMSAVGLLAFV